MEFTIVNPEGKMEVNRMKGMKLLIILTIVSLLIAPALSMPAEKGCNCMSGCCGAKGMSCCSRIPDSSCSSSQLCACSSRILSSSSIEIYGLGYSYLGKGSARPEGKDSDWAVSPYPAKGIVYSGAPSEYSNDIGPPDLDVVEYLPPSAKLVFNALASDGPLTQKDLIIKTDLPPRTVRYALSRLKEESVIKERFNFADARQSLYGLNTAASKAVQV